MPEDDGMNTAGKARILVPRSGKAWHYRDANLALRGELYEPTGIANGCAVLVVHEADGIGGNVRRHCAMLADLGYVAAAADLHGGGRVLEGEEMATAVAAFRTNPTTLRERAHAGYEALCALPGVDRRSVAAIGYCFGGTAVLELARSGAPIAAVASFHGLLTTMRSAEKGTIIARILACTGARDPLVPPEDVAAFQQEMAEAEADWQLMVFGRAMHSFTNESVDAGGDPRMRYDRLADRQSWQILLQFLDDSFATPPPAP